MPVSKRNAKKGSDRTTSSRSAAPKALRSLSSFQPTLSFGPASPSKRKSPIDLSKDDDELMPPPPVPSKAGASRSTLSSTKSSGKGKGKERDAEPADVDVIEIIDSDDNEDVPRKRSLANTGDVQPKALWADLWAPTSVEELAPGKARVNKVREWLYEAIHGMPEAAASSGYQPNQGTRDRLRKYKRILLVTGPAGIGKTTTVRVIAQQLGIDLVEWNEGVDVRVSGGGTEYESSVSKLASFLSRNAYAPLDLGSVRSSGSSGSTSRKAKPRALLLAGLPHLGHTPSRSAFQASLLNFCQSFSSGGSPLIVVHSDTGSGGRAEESWMDHESKRETIRDIVGRDVMDGPWCTEIDFLPLAPTFVLRALNRVLSLAIPDASKRPSSGAIQLITQSSNGDLRSSINSLQLLCTGGGLKSSKRRKTDKVKATGRGSRGGKGAKIEVSDEIRAALDAVTRREQSLNLFHALGKVFYNKRLGDPDDGNADQEEVDAIKKLPPEDPLPEHLKEFERRKSMVQMDTFLPTIPVDASTFALWLEHNIPSFCTDIEELGAILDDFCAADVMRTDDDIWQSSPQAISYALNLNVRGPLMGLPTPVPRQGQKVVKPAFFDSFRLERENGSLLDVAAGHLAKRVILTPAAQLERAEATDDVPVWGGMATKTVLATELVPMAIKIQSVGRRPLLPLSVQPLTLQPYSTDDLATWTGPELTGQGRQEASVEDAGVDAEMAGEDGMGRLPEAGGWDVDVEAKEDGEKGWLEDDDIADWSGSE